MNGRAPEASVAGGAPVPAALQHMAAMLRPLQRKYGFALDVRVLDAGRAELAVEFDDIRIWWSAERVGARWRVRYPQGTRGGERLDMSDGIAAVLAALNEHDDGDGPRAAVAGPAASKRDRGVEVRRQAVIRT